MIARPARKVKLKMKMLRKGEAEKRLDNEGAYCDNAKRTIKQTNMLERGIMGMGLALLLLLFLMWHRRHNRGVESISVNGTLSPEKPKRERKWVWIICITCLVLYIAIAHVISLAWLKGDDYIFIAVNDMGLKERLTFILGRYINWVSRTGDITCSVLGIAENRWQQVLLTPMFIIATPFVLHQLVKREGESIWGLKGWLTILLSVPVMMLSTRMEGGTPWRIFWCYAASVNYLWASVIICWFLTFYRGGNSTVGATGGTSILPCTAMFALGMYSGWSLECVSVLLVPGMLLWYAVSIRQKRHITAPQFAGILGCLFGAFMLFGSPALGRRGASELAGRAFDPGQMSFAESWSFVTNHSTENLALLKGGTVQYLLDGLPVILRPFYAPELLQTLWNCSMAVVYIILLMMVYAVVSKQYRALRGGLLGVLLSVLCACSYLYSCIPTEMSFWPASFILLGTAVYMFVNMHLVQPLRWAMGLAAMGTAAYIIVPAALEAEQYEPYEQARLQYIHSQVAAGVKELQLSPPYPTLPQDKLGLIRCMDLEPNAKTYPNFIAKDYYKVDSISQKR